MKVLKKSVNFKKVIFYCSMEEAPFSSSKQASKSFTYPPVFLKFLEDNDIDPKVYEIGSTVPRYIRFMLLEISKDAFLSFVFLQDKTRYSRIGIKSASG